MKRLGKLLVQNESSAIKSAKSLKDETPLASLPAPRFFGARGNIILPGPADSHCLYLKVPQRDRLDVTIGQ